MPMHVVIAGGGVAGLETLIALRDLAGDRVRVTLIAPEEHFEYRPLSVEEPFALGRTRRVPLRHVARDFDAELIQAGLESVSPSASSIRLTTGDELSYDRLVVAVGALREPGFEHATTFRGQEDSEALHGLIQDVESEYVRRVVFAVPPGVAWSLPLYELALMTAHRARDMGLDSVEVTVVTPEERPLAVFGPGPSAEVARLLEEAHIDVRCSVHPDVPRKGMVKLHPGGEELECDRVVAMPRLRGMAIRSLPQDEAGFIPVDNHARVVGLEHVYAAGDGTNFPVKQGGIACQQADAAAEVIAKAAGAPLEPRSFRPVLRGQLLTGDEPQFMRTNLSGREGDVTQSSRTALWWPPTKVAGRYLAPYLYAREDTGMHPHERELQEYEVETA